MTPTTTRSHRSIFLSIAAALTFTTACDDPDLDADALADPAALEDAVAAAEEAPEAVMDIPALDELAQATPAIEAKFPCRILALGDSITYGYNSNPWQEGDLTGTYWGGYRAHLVASFAQSPSPTVGPILMVGARVDHSTPLQVTWGQASHSGYPMYTNWDIAGTVFFGSSSSNPDIILLHSGTNDIRVGAPPQHVGALANLGVLLENLRIRNPGATVLMAKIIPMTGPYAYLNGEVNAYNAQLGAVAAARQAIGQDVRIVDQNTAFPTATILDGLHPDWAGYAVMAARWRLALDATGC